MSDLQEGGVSFFVFFSLKVVCPFPILIVFLLLLLFVWEGGCSGYLLHVRSDDGVAQALHE